MHYPENVNIIIDRICLGRYWLILAIACSASNGRLSWGEQAYNILSQYQASYPAILDIATYLSLNKLFGRHEAPAQGVKEF
jgi:hypothetical protein